MLCAVAGFSFRASSLSLYFLEQVCDVTAVYEAMLMENFTACSLGFLCMQQKAVREQGNDGKKWNENEKQYECGRVSV